MTKFDTICPMFLIWGEGTSENAQDYFWLYTQELFLIVLRRPYGIPGSGILGLAPYPMYYHASPHDPQVF